MSSLAITWTLGGHGWAVVKVADDHGEAEAIASYITDAPEQFLYAIARLVLGDEEASAELEAEPQVYRWFFRRDGSVVDIRLVLAGDVQAPDGTGAVLWTGRHTITALARSAVRAFDRIDHEQGEEAYESRWGRPFPRTELEALRSAARSRQIPTVAKDTVYEAVANDDRRPPGARAHRPWPAKPTKT
jgi:hypothetical protein